MSIPLAWFSKWGFKNIQPQQLTKYEIWEGGQIVFFVYLDAGTLPHKKAEDPKEEIRIFYVGITRAKRILYLVNNSFYPSPFLEKIQLKNTVNP